ncbi:MAG: ketopantoate reductase family protein [Spirochaetaceae bacterium]
MKVLIYGYGAVGLYYGLKFTEAGYGVTFLDPGGTSGEVPIQFEDGISGDERSKLMRVVSEFPEDETFSLVLVVLPSHYMESHISTLAGIPGSTPVMLLGGYVTGMEKWAAHIGAKRVVFAYPGVSAVFDREERRVLYCDRESGSDELRGVTVGTLEEETEADTGAAAGKAEEAEEAEEAGRFCRLFSDAGIPVTRSSGMRGVYLSQAALRLPITTALLSAGGNLDALAERGDLLRLMIKGIREALAVVRSSGYRLEPSSLSMYRYVPVFIIANMMKGRFNTASSRIGIEKTALFAGDETEHLARRFLDIAEKTSVEDTHLHFLFSIFFDDDEEEEE